MANTKTLLLTVILTFVVVCLSLSTKHGLDRAYKTTVSAFSRPSLSKHVCARPTNDVDDHTVYAAQLLKDALECAPNRQQYLESHQSCNLEKCVYTNVRKRRRRSTIEVPPSFNNSESNLPADIAWEKLNCTDSNVLENGAYMMCPICYYVIIMPETYFPRNISAVTCHAPTSSDGGEDYQCISGEGSCFENRMAIAFKYDVNGTGIANKDNWEDRTFEFTRSCSCRILENSILKDFV